MSPAVQRFSSCGMRIWSGHARSLPRLRRSCAAAADAQPRRRRRCHAAPSRRPAWNPAAPYITAGQDEPGYRSWYLAAPCRAAQVKAFNDYLASAQVGGILPTWQLLRTATSWQDCGGQPFEVPPTSEWPHMVQTLRYVHDYVIPAVGPVEAVSVYRNPPLNDARAARRKARTSSIQRSTWCRCGRSTARR